ncbi:Swi5 domain containing protein [Naviculisporaceae sp. PSN 640]
MDTNTVPVQATTLVKMADLALGAVAKKQPYFAQLLEQNPADVKLIAWYKGFADEFAARLEEFKREVAEAGAALAGVSWGSSSVRGTCECRYDQVNELTKTERVVGADGTGKIKVVFRGFPYHCGGRDLTVLAEDEEEVEALKATYSKPILNLYTFMANIDVAIMNSLELVSLAEADVFGNSTSPTAADNQPSSAQSPEEIVQKHIRLLKEYNDMKDIGQQMIGLVAENRGVPIGSLYESGEYGVTADD